MLKHVLICGYTALRLLLFTTGCSGDLVTTRALPAEQPLAATFPVTDSLSVARHAEFASLLTDGQMLFRQEKYGEAVTLLRRAVALDPNHWQPYYFLGLVKSQSEEFGVADAFLKTSLELAPKDNRLRCQIYVALGENCEAQALYGHALQHYHAALELHPGSDVARQGLERLDHHKLSGR